MRQNSINMIFAVTAEQISVYERLRQHIEGASAGTLSENSENVVDLVKDQYSVWTLYFNIYYYHKNLIFIGLHLNDW